MTLERKVCDYRYLIVGGTTKAATTSLFAYLAAHPSICGATYKETRFFLDSDYPLPSKYRYKGDVEEYGLLFPHSDEAQLRLESTPDYLYCPRALERIAAFLPHAKLVFSLREPISRLISWYRFAKQIGKLPQSLSFDAYVERLFNVVGSKPQGTTKVGAISESRKEPGGGERNNLIGSERTHTEENPGHEQYLQTLKQGCYSIYLKPYFEQLGAARIHILFYEDLAAHPSNVLTEICHFAGIDTHFYRDYAFQVENRTETMKNSGLHRKYRAFRFWMRQWTHNKPIIHNPLRVMRRAVEPLYLRLNTRPTENVHVSKETRHRLVDYYKHDAHELAELIGKPPPWDFLP